MEMRCREDRKGMSKWVIGEAFLEVKGVFRLAGEVEAERRLIRLRTMRTRIMTNLRLLKRLPWRAWLPCLSTYYLLLCSYYGSRNCAIGI